MKKTSIYLEIFLKSLDFLKKGSLHFKKALIPWKISSKALRILEKALYFLLKPPLL
jgi:hypothetical protein